MDSRFHEHFIGVRLIGDAGWQRRQSFPPSSPTTQPLLSVTAAHSLSFRGWPSQKVFECTTCCFNPAKLAFLLYAFCFFVQIVHGFDLAKYGLEILSTTWERLRRGHGRKVWQSVRLMRVQPRLLGILSTLEWPMPLNAPRSTGTGVLASTYLLVLGLAQDQAKLRPGHLEPGHT